MLGGPEETRRNNYTWHNSSVRKKKRLRGSRMRGESLLYAPFPPECPLANVASRRGPVAPPRYTLAIFSHRSCTIVPPTKDRDGRRPWRLRREKALSDRDLWRGRSNTRECTRTRMSVRATPPRAFESPLTQCTTDGRIALRSAPRLRSARSLKVNGCHIAHDD